MLTINQRNTVTGVQPVTGRKTRYIASDGQVFEDKLVCDLYDLALNNHVIISKVVNFVSELVDYDETKQHLTNINFTGFGYGQGLLTHEGVLLAHLLDATGFKAYKHEKYLSIYGAKVSDTMQKTTDDTDWFNY